MKKGYWMVMPCPDSRPLTCMLIDIGRFQWTWLPMGTVVVSDVFQKKLDEIFHNVSGVTGIADDMVIYGKSIKEHDKHFLSFLSIVRKNNLKLSALKLQFQLKGSILFWTKLQFQGNITRSQENSSHSTGHFSTRQRVDAKFPWDGQFLEQIFSMTHGTFHFSQTIV